MIAKLGELSGEQLTPATPGEPIKFGSQLEISEDVDPPSPTMCTFGEKAQ